jgi:hypothetical protein
MATFFENWASSPGISKSSGSGWAGHPDGGVTASTETLAAKWHAGGHSPVIECTTISANQEMAYAA